MKFLYGRCTRLSHKTNYIYLCPYITITIVEFIYSMNSVNILVHSLRFILKNLKVDRITLLSVKHVFVFFMPFFEYFTF
jgi:hypothetical protein